jgi:16S rRNA (guanine966-N2)-methyltransferase
MLKNQIRIIGGEWRSRQIHFIEVPGLRPTPSRVRETLFNWLQNEIPGSRCLDLFAGSGALGFEAASRGAKSVVQVEQDANACRALHANASKLNARQIKIVNADVFRYLATNAAESFDIVFLDPPFGQGLAAQACRWLEDKGWLNPDALVYAETEVGGRLLEEIPDNWRPLKSKTAGEVSYRLFSRQ